ncbi:MAG: Do family serine endopeptidase [Acidobacteriota bacterium]
MSLRCRTFSIARLARLAVLAVLLLAGSLPGTAALAAPRGSERPEPTMVVLPDFADIVERVQTAVVSITSTEIIRPEKRGQGRRPTPFHDPFEFFFGPERERRRFHQEEERREDSGGSGFVVSEDGYILTNFHVIEDADRIRVRFNDNIELPAEVIGTDPPTDLALLKVHAGKPLPTIPFGDSSRVRVGEWVMAIGNPLAYEHTVTVGVVSAKARKLPELSRDFALDNFIQTDAAINFGNSGGPLLNTRGEVIGINSAISRFGQGISFAVPINMAREVMVQLKATGRVARGFLGISISEVTEEKQEYFQLESRQGAFVEAVTPGLPAEESGIRKGDVIIAVGEKPVTTSDELIRMISAKPPGSKIDLRLIRDGRKIEISTMLVDRAESIPLAQGGAPKMTPRPREGTALEKALGMTIEELTPETRRYYNVPSKLEGALVTRVSQLGPAFEQGIREGDVITEVNRVRISNAAQYRAQLKKTKHGDIVALYVETPRSGSSRFVTLRIPEE